MGMDTKVVFPANRTPSWPALAQEAARLGMPLQLRMIDGALAFPDETPPDAWRELRVGAGNGMVTLRREDDGIRLVIWGNADAPLRQASDTLAQVIAALTEGDIERSG